MSFIQNFFTSRDNNSNSATYVGQQDRLWWDPVTNRIYVSDGVTPGGIPVNGGGNADLGNWAFVGNTQYNINGGQINNSDLMHGPTAWLQIPENGSANNLGLLNYYGNVSITAAVDPGNTQAWTFDSSGNLTLPTNTSSINYANGTPYGGTAGASNKIFNGNSYANIADPNGNVEINANGQAWTFDTAGNLTATGNLKLVTNENLWNFDTNGTLTLPGNTLQLGLIAGNTGLKNLNSANVSVNVDDNLWNFGTDGNLTLPGNAVSINYANGQPYGGSGNATNITVQNQGNTLTTALNTMNFTGNAVTATNVGNVVTVNINASGGYIPGVFGLIIDGGTAPYASPDFIIDGGLAA